MASIFDIFNRVRSLPQQIASIPQLFNPPKPTPITFKTKVPPPPPPPKAVVSSPKNRVLDLGVRGNIASAQPKVRTPSPVGNKIRKIGQKISQSAPAKVGKGFMAPAPGTYKTNTPEGFGEALSFATPLGIGAGILKTGAKVPKAASKATKVLTTFDDAALHLADRVGKEVKTSFVQKFAKGVKGIMPEIKAKLVDSFSPIEDAINIAEKKGNFKLPAMLDPRLLRNRVLGSTDIAKQALKQDLEPVLKQIGAKGLDQFNQYLAARHALDLTVKKIKTGIDPKKAKVFVRELSPQFEERAKEITAYTRKILKLIADNGLISKQTYDDLLKKYPNYVPMNRIFEELDDIAKPTLLPKKAVGSLSKQTIVQKLKGSEREIRNPLESIIDQTIRAFDEVERNRVAQSIANLRNYEGFKEVIKPTFRAGGKNTISVYEKGRKVFYEVPKEFAEAAKNLDAQTMGVLEKVFAMPVRVLRAGLTGVNIPFIASNVIRDQQFAALTSSKAAKTSIANPYNFAKAFFDTVKQSGAYDDFLASGGGSSYFLSTSREGLKPTMKALAGSKGEKIKTIIKNPLRTIEDLVSIAEQSTRTQQFRGMRSTQTKVDPFAAPTEELLQAVKAGRENTVDFAKKGAWGKTLNSVFIYLNAGIQGARTTGRAFKKDPLGTSLKMAATVYTPVALTTLWNTATPERREAYMDIPQWERGNYLIVLPPNPVKNEKGNYIGAIKVPLPQTFSSLAVPIRAAIEHLGGVDQTKIADVLLELTGGLAGGYTSEGALISRLTPTAITPPIEQFTGKSLFTGGDIIPKEKQSLSPELQSREDTSGALKLIGQKWNLSPAIIQNYIKGYTGEVGLQVLNALDTALAKAGVIPEEEIGGRSIVEGILRRFTRVSAGELENKKFDELEKYAQDAADRLYKEREEAKKIYEQIKNAPVDQKNQLFEKLVNESNIDRISELVKDQELGETATDRYLKRISPPERASYIKDRIKGLKTNEEKNAYIDELLEKGILTDDTIDEIINSTVEVAPTPAPQEQSSIFENLNPQKVAKEAADITKRVIAKVPEQARVAAQESIPAIVSALKEEGIDDPKVLAYALATIEHETAGTFEPIEEYDGVQQARRLGYEGGENYFGRGFIQLTHLKNYREIGERIGIDLANNPEKALDPAVAAKILAIYFKDNGVADLAKRGDFYAARGPINGTDSANSIARLANKYLASL